MEANKIESLLIGTKLIDTITGDELSYLRYVNDKVVCTDENGLTIWLSYDRVEIKE